MKKYLILGPNFPDVNCSYKGIDRSEIPNVPNDPVKAKLINESIYKYMENTDPSVKEGEYFRDYRIALEIAQSFTLHNDKGEVYEVIQVVYSEEESTQNRTLLGYDVLSTNESGSMIVGLLSQSLKQNRDLESYCDLLNDNYLFQNQILATDFCKAIRSKFGTVFFLEIVGVYS